VSLRDICGKYIIALLSEVSRKSRYIFHRSIIRVHAIAHHVYRIEGRGSKRSRSDRPRHLQQDRTHTLLQGPIVLSHPGLQSQLPRKGTGDEYWISGPRRDGLDRLYGKSALVVEIDDDVREEYLTEIRKKPEQSSKSHT
jgi:hypothetical protein